MNDDWIILEEYGHKEFVTMSTESADIITDKYKNALTLTKAGPGQYHLSANSYVGTLVLPDLNIRIYPKIPIPVLWDWMGRVFEIKSIEIFKEQTIYEEQFGDPDWIARLFLQECWILYRKGILKGYIQLREPIGSVRGTYHAPATHALWLNQDYRFECTFEDFTSWVPENQRIYSGLQAIRHWKFHDAKINQDATALLNVFGNEKPAERSFVVEAKVELAHLERHQINRLNLHYTVAFQLLRLIWQKTAWSMAKGKVKAFSFLLDMNELFERYVTARLAENLEPFDYTVMRQKHETLTVESERKITIWIDILVRDPKGREVILDTKYKRIENGWINADAFQVVSYMTARNSRDAILIYAAGVGNDVPVIIKNTGMRLLKWSMQLDKAPLENFTQHVEQKLKELSGLIRGQFN